MQQNEDVLGGRLPLLDPRVLEGEQAHLHQVLTSTLVSWGNASGFRGATADGRLIGPFNPFLYSQRITPGFLTWMQAEANHTSLTKRVHEVVILSVGAVWKSPFELYAHAAVARKAGLSDAAISALVQGGSSDELAEDEKVAHRFARQLASERRVGDDLYREAEAVFGRGSLVDMTYLIGLYLLTCALLNVFEIPAPE